MFTEKLGWLFREQATSDFGVDAHVEVVAEGRATGRLLALQIKSGESYFRQQDERGIVYYGDPHHLDYWSRHSLPVALILYDPSTDTVYWQHISERTVSRTSKRWKVYIPRDQRLSSSSADDLEALAEGDPYVLRLRRLQLERQWMQRLYDGERLLLEVDEWVNKSSGRGDFRLRAQTPDGKEQVVRQWPFQLFPGIPYEELLPALFPWADLAIDDIFYEAYDEARWDLEEGMWDSEDRRYIHFDSFQEWAEDALPTGIRPYEDNGEVASWRLELLLNEVGRSFLALDEYLNQSD